MVRVFVDDLLDFVCIQILLEFVAQVQNHTRAAQLTGDGLGGECTRAVAHPAHCLGSWRACTARFDGDFVGDDKA